MICHQGGWQLAVRIFKGDKVFGGQLGPGTSCNVQLGPSADQDVTEFLQQFNGKAIHECTACSGQQQLIGRVWLFFWQQFTSCVSTD
jgi:hypothetical protein